MAGSSLSHSTARIENIQQEGAVTIFEFETSDDCLVTVVVPTVEGWKERPCPCLVV